MGAVFVREVRRADQDRLGAELLEAMEHQHALADPVGADLEAGAIERATVQNHRRFPMSVAEASRWCP
jgi:hypothetical protein